MPTDKSIEFVTNLRTTLSKMELSLREIKDSIIWIDENGIIQWCNEKFCQLVDLPHIVVLGKCIYDLLSFKHTGEIVSLKNILAEQLKQNDSQNQIYGLEKNNKIIYFEIFVKPFYEKDQKTSIVVVLHDITEVQQLMIVARQAGMSEVAASILHNIGNVINSIGVSLTILKENTESPLSTKIALMNDILMENKSNLSNYFQCDEKGKLIPAYLLNLFNMLVENNKNLKHETDNVLQAYEHIKEIISTQNEIAGRQVNILEKVSLSELIDSAITMVIVKQTLNSKDIKLIKEYNYLPLIKTNRGYLIQIFVNLLKNAKDSLEEIQEIPSRTIIIKTNSSSVPKHVEIRVKDNGIGMSPETITKIFSFGFTLKKKGHGFGLHNSLLMVKELGGTLRAESEGLGKGAEFILTIPVAQ